MEKLYVSAWLLGVFTSLVAFFTGYFNPVTLVASSLIVLGLVYGLALWSVFTNMPDMAMPKVFDRNN